MSSDTARRMVVFRNRARRVIELPELLLTSPHWPGVRKQNRSILVLDHLLDSNPVLAFGGEYQIAWPLWLLFPVWPHVDQRRVTARVI
jgi:hypothetical protein